MRARLPDRIHHLPLALIDEGQRLRPVNPSRAAEIAASWQVNGQLTPIEVAPADAAGRHLLIAGGHRLTAARQMGEATIAAVIVEVADDDARRLREIDENLFRAELSPLDEAIFLAERKAIYERMNPGVAWGGDRRSAAARAKSQDATLPKARSFADDVAERIGLHRATVFRALARIEGLSAESLARLRGTPLAEIGVEIDALAKLSPEQQAAVLDLVLPVAGEPKAPGIRAAWKLLDTTAAAAPEAEAEAEAQLKRLRAAWNAAEPEVQAAFLAWAKKHLREGGR